MMQKGKVFCMDELKEMLEKEMKLRKNLTIVLVIILLVLVFGGGFFVLCLTQLQGSLNMMLDVLGELDVDSLNSSIKGLSDVLNELDMQAVNGSLQETQKALSEFNEAVSKISSITGKLR